MRQAIVLALLLVGAVTAPAQTLKRDSATGNWHLTYTDGEGKTHTVVVEARDQVAPALFVALESSPGATVYRYELRHLIAPQARTPIAFTEVPYPGATAVSAPGTWNATLRTKVRRCEFSGRIGHQLKPGERVQDLVIRSAWLPIVSTIQVYGPADAVHWASPVGSIPDRAYELADSVSGRNGGGFRLEGVVPGRDPAQLSPGARGIEWLSSDLERACALGWVSHVGVCNSLRTKLDNARKSLDRGNVAAVRGQLDAFLQELNAQRGKHVDDNAYALLHLIGQETRRRL